MKGQFVEITGFQHLKTNPTEHPALSFSAKSDGNTD